MVNVVIAEDQEVIREGIKLIIEQDPEIKVVGLAENGNEAVKLCEKFEPDLVLMDLVMPVCDGAQGTQLIKSRFKSIKVVILTTFNDMQRLSQILNYGADGYVLKDVKPGELKQLIKSVASGLKMVHPNVLQNINTQNPQPEVARGSSQEEPVRIPAVTLTDREKSVLKLIVLGRNNKEIAQNLYLTEGRVKNIVTNILDKFQFKDRTQLAIYAVKNNLV